MRAPDDVRWSSLYEASARTVNLRVLSIGSALALVLAPLFYLVDRVALHGEALADSARWRGVACLLALASILLSRVLSRASGLTVIGAIQVVALLHAVNIGYGVGRIDAADRAYVGGVYLFPFLSVPLLGPLRLRVVLLPLVSAALLCAYFAGAPAVLHGAVASTIAALLAFSTFMAIVLGHAGTRLMLSNWQRLQQGEQARAEIGRLNGELAVLLQDQTAQVHALAARLQEVHELERARIARDLHDGLGQTLSALGMEMSRGRLDPARSAAILSEAQGALRGAVWDLRPIGSDGEDLPAALRRLCADAERRTGADCDWQIDLEPADLGRIGAACAVALYRILQEGLTNVARHARARRVWIRVTVTGDALVGGIEDDGAGIEIGEAPRGHGLRGMHERAFAVGGQVAIERRPGGGTTVRAVLPLPPAAPEGAP